MLVAFVCYLIGVGLLGWAAHRYFSSGSFVKGYFLGNRMLGPWVLALSFAATAISGGSFMGFPSLIYTNGWVMALWIAGYMVVPLSTMAVLGKRLNQAGRLSGAVTVPDLLRDRYESPAVGLVTSLILVVFLGENLVAQFKAGALLMVEAWRDHFEPWGWTAAGSTIAGLEVNTAYFAGLCLFVGMVVTYTVYGGFWGVTLTDVLEGLVMLFGAVTLAALALHAAGGLGAATEALHREDPALVFGPGPPYENPAKGVSRAGYLPPILAVSFFFQWTIIGMGQPGQFVRLMSFRDSLSLKRALCMCAVYYALIYTSIVTIFICARALYPPSELGEASSDQIMPFMIRKLGSPISPVLAGFLLAAPYAAIMSTVAAYLLVVSSSLVRDIYQRFVSPGASQRTVKGLSYAVTALVGLVAFARTLHPPRFLQDIIVYSTEGLGVSLLAPVCLGLFWRRATWQGALAGLLGGMGCHFGMYAQGNIGLLVSLPTSFLLAIAVSLATPPASPETLKRYFFR
ncbi:MAG: sodium/solute symporter [Planctomycetes bacterium]|nr:sodium/solute symporter [Planctomycetota bacterium]